MTNFHSRSISSVSPESSFTYSFNKRYQFENTKTNKTTPCYPRTHGLEDRAEVQNKYKGKINTLTISYE